MCRIRYTEVLEVVWTPPFRDSLLSRSGELRRLDSTFILHGSVLEHYKWQWFRRPIGVAHCLPR